MTKQTIVGYGATCNNMYRVIRFLRKAGVDAFLLQEPKDNFPHSFPCWDDVEAAFTGQALDDPIDWRQFQSENEWIAPSWYYGSSDAPEKKLTRPRSGYLQDFVFVWLAKLYLKGKPAYLEHLSGLRGFDCAIVSGFEPVLVAFASGVRYFIWPQGTEMRRALGIEPGKRGWRSFLLDAVLRRAFRRADWVGSHLPDASAELMERKKQYSWVEERIRYCPLPYVGSSRLAKVERRKLLKEIGGDELADDLENKLIGFVPSRLAFEWKGQDILLEALSKLEPELSKSIHLIVLNWGGDREKLASQLSSGFNGPISLVDTFCSVPRLKKWFQSVDFVIDELKSPVFGSALCEAMSVGCPVITKIGDLFEVKGWEVPPFVNVDGVDEIASALQDIASGQLDLERIAIAQTSWYNDSYSEEAALKRYRELFPDSLWEEGS